MSDDVGYGRPPKHSRWKKGQSGNPKGRKKAASPKTFDHLQRELAEVVEVIEGGRRRRVTKERLLIKSLLNRAIKDGDIRAAALVFKLYEQHAPGEAVQVQAKALSANDQKILEAYLEREVNARLDRRAASKGDTP